MAGDPYKYFRVEARELLEVLSQGVLELERGPLNRDSIGRLLRAAHTLKGASRVVKQTGIADLAHAVEDVLTPHRDGQGPIPAARTQELLRLLDAMASRVSSLAPPAEASAPPRVEERFQTVRVETSDMDRLLASVTQAGAQLTVLRDELRPVERAQSLNRELRERLSVRRDAGAGRVLAIAEELQGLLDGHARRATGALDEADRELGQVRDTADALRLLPASTVFAPLERALRDAAQSLRKAVEFNATGGDTRLDAHVLAALQDVLLHVVRNAVAHGIETENERSRSGKPPAGRVEIRVERTGNRILFACQDDGRGIDVEAVRRAAARRNLLPASELAALGPEQLVQLILKGGVSTSGTPSEVSGRGIGLDVVRETIARLQGEVGVRSVPGHGTTFELRVPFSLSSIPALLVEAGDITCCFPVDAVETTLRLPHGEIARAAAGASIVYDGASVPFIPLTTVLGGPPQGGFARTWSVVVLQSRGRTAAVGVDRLLGTANILLKPLPAWVGADPIVAGASLNASGDPWLVLDPGALMSRASAPWHEEAGAGPARAPLLVVDDSLTTRMLEQSILESAGYAVDLAVSGEEALRKARERRYGMMIVDVEMPGMDGFELVARSRSDPALRDVPAILVTSRSSPEDRRRGEEAGARAYIVKSEFDQNHLLNIIRELVG